MKQGLICLIPKPNKDFSLLDNWRPITLLNSDYKILASVYAEKIKYCLAIIISNTQSGFLKGRHISNNIRLIIDILDYSEFINKEALFCLSTFIKLSIQLSISLFLNPFLSLVLVDPLLT